MSIENNESEPNVEMPWCDHSNPTFEALVNELALPNSKALAQLSVNGIKIFPAIEDESHPDYAKSKEIAEVVTRKIKSMKAEDMPRIQSRECIDGYNMADDIQ